MFGHLRYFAVIGLFVVLCLAVAVGIHFRSTVEEGMIKNVIESQNISYAHGLANALNRYLPSIRNAKQNKTSLGDDVKNAIKHDVAFFLTITPILQISVYSYDGKIIAQESSEYSRLFSHLLMVTTEHNGNSNIVSFVISDQGFLNSIGIRESKTVLRTIIPISQEAELQNSLPDYIVEINYDVTLLWRKPLMLQIKVTVAIIFIFILLFLGLYFAVYRAERIIARQHDANLELVAAKLKAETESIEKSKFLANVSHELRTPLNAIIGFSEIIKDEVMGPIGNEQYKDYVTDIYASGVHLLSLINDILDYSKAEAGKLEINLADVDITKVMKSCLRLIMPRAEEAQVSLVDKIPSKHFVVQIDSKRFKQILLNLLSNAVKFTPAGGKITLHSWYDEIEAMLHIEVQDTGIGIAAKDISKVMSTFGQVENEYNRKYDGTGLGLPLTKKLVELMRGRFDIKSEVGSGTTVTISFPFGEKVTIDYSRTGHINPDTNKTSAQ